jgi:hypothetical protein
MLISTEKISKSNVTNVILKIFGPPLLKICKITFFCFLSIYSTGQVLSKTLIARPQKSFVFPLPHPKNGRKV